MNTLFDYESMGQINFNNRQPVLLESFAGTAIVQWHGKIERQLVSLLADAEKSRNFTYADKVREFLKIWRSNEISGSINRETIEVLKSASDILAIDTWNLASYFSSLRDQLRILVASEEELPRGTDMNQNDPMAGGGGGGGGGAPPMSPSFGPEEEKPPGAESAEGTEVPPPGTEGGAPGEGEGLPPEEAGMNEPGAPGEIPGEENEPEKDLERF